MWILGSDDEPSQMISGDDLAFEEYAPLTKLLSHKEIMQFTGLFDKNGLEIYEGDVIKSFLGRVAVVEWEKEGRFLGFTVGSERKIIYINREPKVEIIGNIYENPELLEGARGK
jgi:hypothetical protein